MASKYGPLSDFLRSKPRGEFTLTFKQIEEVFRFPLSKSAERPAFPVQYVASFAPPLSTSPATPDKSPTRYAAGLQSPRHRSISSVRGLDRPGGD